jgi:hypothetical protein
LQSGTAVRPSLQKKAAAVSGLCCWMSASVQIGKPPLINISLLSATWNGDNWDGIGAHFFKV